ncbi:MAG: MFS transporter [Rhodospirillales bacterium]|nr:MFS transporter [Rhodospirillales bacterium]
MSLLGPSFIQNKLQPLETVDEAAYAETKKWLLGNGIAAQVMETLAIGTFMTAFALHLGASNAFIGLIAAMPSLASLGQLLGIVLVEHIRNRRLICVIAGLVGRIALIGLPAAALIGDPVLSLPILFAAICFRYGMGAIVGCSWNAWIRDVIDDKERGRLMGRRLAWMTGIGMLVSIAASAFIDSWEGWSGFDIRYAYAAIFGVAMMSGFVGIYCMTRMSEPRMPPDDGPLDLRKRLSEPFRDENFRKLMFFLAAWNFAANLAAPFFTVHMLTRLGLDLFPVTVFAMCSQLANIIVLKSFGRIADRMSNKAVLAVAAPLFIACTFAWIFTTATDTRWAVMAILASVHVLTGVATAGVSIATTNITMKLAPKGNSTSYLATNSLVSSLSAGIAPVLGGLCADFFAHQKLSLLLRWDSGDHDVTFETISLEHWDFYFVMAALIGLYSLHRLAMVREEGEIDQRAVITEVFTDARRTIRNISSIAGLRVVAEFPFSLLLRAKRKNGRRDGRDSGEHQ